MARIVKDRGGTGHDSILFHQQLDYPRVPGAISYYPPEPSDELRKQVKKDKAGGLVLYIIGFATVIIGFLGAMEFSRTIEIYATLIPFLLVLGLVFAILYLIMDNVALAKLSRTLPAILMLCLALLYILSMFMAITDLASVIDGGDQNSISSGLDNIFSTLLNPAFFFMSAGLLICRAGGTMLWSSTKVVNQYIPGMIIIETPDAVRYPAQEHAEPQETSTPAAPIRDMKDAESDQKRLCETCSQPMTYIEEYGRYYCYDCETYGSE